MPVQALKTQKNLNVAEGLTLSNLEYFPSEGRIEQSREKLLQSAMKEFQNKASIAAKGFGKPATPWAKCQLTMKIKAHLLTPECTQLRQT